MNLMRKTIFLAVVCAICLLCLSWSIAAQRRRSGQSTPHAQTPAPPLPTPQPKIFKSYDSANDRTLVATRDYKLQLTNLDAAETSLTISVAYMVERREIKHHPDAYIIVVNSLSARYRFVDYMDLKILADGKAITLGRMLRRPSVNNGLAEETLSTIISPPTAILLANAQRLDFEVGLFSNISAPAEFILALRELVASAPPYDPSHVTANPEPEKKLTPCTASNAPTVRGFRLGMSPQESLSRFAGLTLAPQDNIPRGYTPPNYPTRETYGQAFVTLSVYKFSDYERYTVKNQTYRSDIAQGNYKSALNANYFTDLAGVSSIKLTFVDQKLAVVEINYTDDIKWASLKEFAAKTAESLGLSGDWERGGIGYELKCQGFSVEAATGYPGMTLKLSDKSLTQLVAERRKEAEETEKRRKREQKEGFRP